MPKVRKSHPPSLKAKVAVEAIKAHKTAAQIAQMFGVHPTQVGAWKKQALAGLPDVFGNGREQMREQTDAERTRSRARRMMRILGIGARYPKPNLSRPAPGHQVYPYLLRGVGILPPTTSGAPILRTF